MRPAGAETDNSRFDYAMQKGKVAGKVDEDPKRQREVLNWEGHLGDE